MMSLEFLPQFPLPANPLALCGVLLLAGDEIGRTQGGNNIAYCQDNDTSWINWNLDPDQRTLLEFARTVVRLRREHPAFRRRHFFRGRPIRGGGFKEIMWLNPDGREMSDEEWNNSFARCLGVYLAGEVLEERDERGRTIADNMLAQAAHAFLARMPASVRDMPRCER